MQFHRRKFAFEQYLRFFFSFLADLLLANFKTVNNVGLILVAYTLPHCPLSRSICSLVKSIVSMIWGFYGGDYVECCLLGYKNPVRTSQDTHYISATEPSQLILYKGLRFSRRWLWRMPSSWTLRSVLRLLVNANVVPSSLILLTLMMEALHSPETSVLTRATRRNIQKDGILHSHRRENLKSYKDTITAFHCRHFT
jgi:hypothetical protein